MSACSQQCDSTRGCLFFSHSQHFRSCVLCSACDLTADGLWRGDMPKRSSALHTDVGVRWLARQRPTYTSWARVGLYDPVDPHRALAALEEELQGSYSSALYGKPGLVPRGGSLRLVWLQLLPAAAVELVKAIGICRSASMPPFAPLFSPISAAHPVGRASTSRLPLLYT